MIIVDVLATCVANKGTRHTNDISIEFEIQFNFVMLLFQIHVADHNNNSNTVVTCAKFRCDRLGTF